MKIKVRCIPYLLICIGIFIFPYILRNSMFSIVANINFLVYFGLFLAYKKRVIRIESNKIIKFLLITFILSASSLLVYVKGNGYSYFMKLKLLFVYVLPILFLNIKISRKEDVDFFIMCWWKFIKYVCRIMVVLGLADKLLGNVIQRLWVTMYNSPTLEGMMNSGRLVSFYGHPLENAGLFLTFLCWILILKEVQNIKYGYVFNILTALLGLAMTGSKSGIILGMLLLILYNIGLKNLKYMIVILGIIMILYVIGAFDLVFNRIMQGIAIGDLSTSRNSAITRLLENGTIKFTFFKGNTIDYSYKSMIAALEYPFLRWSYTNGIIFMIVMYLGYFVIPAIRVIRCKNIRVVICIVALMIYNNGNNGISAFNDDLLMYSINIGLIILNMKKYKGSSTKILTGGATCAS